MREALVYAVGVALSPVPIAASIVILTSPRALAKSASFVAGWALGVAFVITLLVVMVDEARISDSHPSWIAVPELVLGAAFVGAALVLWVRRRRRRAQAVPWLDAVDDLSRVRSAGLGVIFAAANPKVVALALGSASLWLRRTRTPDHRSRQSSCSPRSGSLEWPFRLSCTSSSRIARVRSSLGCGRGSAGTRRRSSSHSGSCSARSSSGMAWQACERGV